MGDYRRAIQDFDIAIELNPEFQWAYYNRGLAFAFINEYDQAIQDYGKAIELNPEDAAAYNDRGNCYRSLIYIYENAAFVKGLNGSSSKVSERIEG